ncbi:hypothetical protein GYMLUDRAFT_32701 [Collybiopsis luxurians FD-317 M1]|nr:hypothetical protein GYMLUDRAFT_32701 [Collybiopsis luxurians FD-317 M1]
MHAYRTSYSWRISSVHVRFNSSDAQKLNVKRLADTWGDIHIPSRQELKEAERATPLSARLASRRPAAVASTLDAQKPVLIPVTSRPAEVESSTKFPKRRDSSRIQTSRKEARQNTSPRSSKASLQSAADTLDDLFQVIPEESSSHNTSWNKGLETIKKSASQRPRKPISGQVWTPEGSTTSIATKKHDGRAPKREYKAKEDTRDRGNEALVNAEDELEGEGEGEWVEFEDETSVDGVSLIAPERGQTVQMWYEKIIAQNREPLGPHALTPDVEISSDLHALFGVDRARQQSALVSSLGALQRGSQKDRPAVKKGKVDYQYRKALRRIGGDYSHIQPNLMSTDLRRMRPSQVAMLALSRQTEASTSQRKKFVDVVSYTLRDVDNVPVHKSQK